MWVHLGALSRTSPCSKVPNDTLGDFAMVSLVPNYHRVFLKPSSPAFRQEAIHTSERSGSVGGSRSESRSGFSGVQQAVRLVRGLHISSVGGRRLVLEDIKISVVSLTVPPHRKTCYGLATRLPRLQPVLDRRRFRPDYCK